MKINHILLIARDMPAMRDFFVNVIGFEDGPRPPFPFEGHWLYSDGAPQIHLATASGGGAQAAYLGSTREFGRTGAIDHLAITGADFPRMVQRLEKSGTEHFIRRVPAEHHVQVFVAGPEGIKVEMLFPMSVLPSAEALPWPQ